MRLEKMISFRQVISFFILTVIGMIFTFPMIWMFLTAFRSEVDLTTRASSYIPETWTLEGFKLAFEMAPIGRWAINSVAMTVIITFAVLLTSTLIGYVFAVYDFKLKKIAFVMILATMMIPGQVVMIPRFLMIQKVGLYDTLAAVIVPNLISIYNIYFCRIAIENLPRSLFDAAVLDGAGPLRIYWNVVIPNILPTVSAVGIFSALGAWNNYMDPLLYLNDQNKMTLPLAISWFAGQHTTTKSATMAVVFMLMVPMVIVFLVFEQFFIKGINITRK